MGEMPDRPGISVLVPTHDRPTELTRAVQSAVDQDYAGAIEVLVVFDGAEPFHPDVVVPPNRDVRTIVNTHRRGLAGARNTGIESASHDFVAFLDDDDWWLDTKLSRQMDLLLSLPDAPLVGSGIAMMTPDGRVDRPFPARGVTHADLLRDRVAELHSSSFLLRRAALLGELGVIDEDLPGSYAEDYDLVLRASHFGPLQGVPEPLAMITFAGGSLFATKWQMIAEALTRVLAKHPEFEVSPKGYARIAGQVAFAYAAQGRADDARLWSRAALRRNPLEMRGFLALLAAHKVVSPDRVMRELQKRGRGL